MKQPTPEQQTATAAIESLDATLQVHSSAWQDAAPERKPDWLRRLDMLLDRRIDHMKIRDTAPIESGFDAP